MKNKTYKKKIDKEWFKEREKVSRLFDKIDFHKIVYVFLLVFIVSSCSQNSKKNWLTYGTGVGTGMAGYSLTKSFLGKSGTGGNINQVIAITTLSTLLGVFMGSEIADNIYQEEQEVLNVSMNKNSQTTWSMIDEKNNKEVITKIAPTEEITSNFGQQRCKKFNFSMEEGGFIKRGEGYACQNNKTGNWEMLGVELL
tara:strand:- start:92 stop:682 length:591 start_codon:yes stop_codon:yes gene_type:complete